ncbi:MAG TPA: DUF3375 domain-containing protein [Chitinophagaceae bacterium]
MLTTDISYLFDASPAVQMIRLRNAHWVLPFLYRVFKADARFSIPEPELTGRLVEELSGQVESREDFDEARIEFGEDEQSRARKYLLSWVQKRLLQDFPDSESVTQYQLSAHTEKVFQWLQSLESRSFVGTESRFRFLFQTLKEMIEYTEDNTAARLEDLKSRRAEIDKEIKRLEMGHKPEVYTNAQVQERLDWFTRLSYELLSDFREVEDNFKQIHRGIVEQHTRAEITKGAIIGYAFEAYDALRLSDQGKSFYAFWDFLISRTGQQEWRELTGQLIQLLEDREIDADKSFIQNIKSLLLQQGRSVYDANDKMAEKLSRIITEKEMARHRRLRQQVGSIKDLVLQLMDEGEVPAGISLSDPIDVKMSMERKLTLAPRQVGGAVKQPSSAPEKIVDPERFSRFLSVSHIDKKKLWAKVEELLQRRQTATLAEVIRSGGLVHGVAEVVSYYSFLKEKTARAQIIDDLTELIPLDGEETHFIEVPYLLFSR